MRVAAELIAVLRAAFAVLVIRSGWREWRDRSGLIIGLGFAFMAIMLADFGVINLGHAIKAEALVFAAAAAGMIVCFALCLSILSFTGRSSWCRPVS